MAVSWPNGLEFHTVAEAKEFLERFTALIIEEAKFAQQRNVEFFSLGEPDHLLPNSRDQERAALVNWFKGYVLPKLRAVYNGKVYYQIGDAVVWDFTKLNASGLDFFGVLIGGECNLEQFKQTVDNVYAKAEQLASEQNTPWVISELWINKRYEDCTVEREPYYEYIFSKPSRHLIGIMIDTWNVDEPGFETSIKGTPAEQVIEDFFAEWR